MHRLSPEEAQTLTDTVHSFSGLTEMLSVGPSTESGGAPLTAPGAAPIMACCKTDTESYFCFWLFFIKVKILSKLLEVSQPKQVQTQIFCKSTVAEQEP